LHFDNAIIEKIDPEQAVVLKVNMGWSDPGTLYALKEALEPKEKNNYEKGLVVSHKCVDSFVYNEESEKLVSAVGRAFGGDCDLGFGGGSR
jgi:mannose-1-phosphate guanylyltransferase